MKINSEKCDSLSPFQEFQSMQLRQYYRGISVRESKLYGILTTRAMKNIEICQSYIILWTPRLATCCSATAPHTHCYREPGASAKHKQNYIGGSVLATQHSKDKLVYSGAHRWIKFLVRIQDKTEYCTPGRISSWSTFKLKCTVCNIRCWKGFLMSKSSTGVFYAHWHYNIYNMPI